MQKAQGLGVQNLQNCAVAVKPKHMVASDSLQNGCASCQQALNTVVCKVNCMKKQLEQGLTHKL